MMKKQGFILIFTIIFVFILTACGKNEVRPAEINEGTDTCEVCNMAVVDNQFATQIVLENGKSLIFDDMGCMYTWLNENKDKKIAEEFVRDYNDKEWIPVKEATYIYNQNIKTPMAYNVISFKDEDSAKKFANDTEGSKLLTADELEKHSWKVNEEMMKKEGMKEHSHSSDGDHHDMSH